MRALATANRGAVVERLHPSLGFRARLGAWTPAWGTACALLDGAMVAAAIAATAIGSQLGGAPSVPPLALAGFGALTLVLFQARGLYQSRLRLDALDDARTIVAAVTIAAMAVLCVLLVANLEVGSSPDLAAGMARLWAFAAVYLVAGRVALYWSQVRARRNGEVVSPTVVVGTGPVGRRVAGRLLATRDLGLLPIGFVDPDGEATASREGELAIPVLGSTRDIDRIVSAYDITQVVVNCAHGLVDDDLVPFVDRCEKLGVSVAFVPSAHEKVAGSLRVEYVGGLALITSHRADPKGWQFAAKYALDRLLAAALIVAAAPALVACALAVLITMGRPVLFRQPRVGLDGREFDMLKFRSMSGSPTAAGEADAAWAARTLGDGSASAAAPAEDRRTPVGTFLRRSSLDELPQLLNVLKGDMSLVGPRPERTHYVRLFEDGVYRYGERHRVKSGVTGWAQVHGLRGDTSLEDRIEWDNWYIENWTLWLDLKVLLLTGLAVVRFFKRGG